MASEPVLSAVALLLIYVLFDQTRMSLHPLYKRRLASAFALERAQGGTGPGGPVGARECDWNTPSWLSEFGSPNVGVIEAGKYHGQIPGGCPAGTVEALLTDYWVHVGRKEITGSVELNLSQANGGSVDGKATGTLRFDISVTRAGRGEIRRLPVAEPFVGSIAYPPGGAVQIGTLVLGKAAVGEDLKPIRSKWHSQRMPRPIRSSQVTRPPTSGSTWIGTRRT
jgi:hypothetical protein